MTTLHRVRSVASAALIAGMLAVAAPTPAAGQAVDPALQQNVTADEAHAPQGERTVITAGHVDLGPQVIDGKLIFLARDDTAMPPVWRRISDVVFDVDQAAGMTLPEGSRDFDFTGAAPGDTVWVVPQTEAPNVPWLGWNTQAPSLLEAGVDRGVTLEFLGHEGPGEFSLFLQNGGFEPPQVLWRSADTGAQPLFVDLNTHTHANWVFTQPGVHQVKLRVRVPLTNGEEMNTEEVVRFAVGGAAPEEAFATQWTSTDTADTANTSDDAPAATPQQSAAAEQSSNSTLVWAGVGLAVVGIALAVASFLVGRNAHRRREAAAQVGGNL